MKRLLVLLSLFNVVVAPLSGCSSLHHLEGSTAEVRARIASGELLKRGDRVRILTLDGLVHKLAISALRDQSISGHTEALLGTHWDKFEVIPINQVIEVDKRRFSFGKTVALGTVLLIGGMAIYASSHLSLAGLSLGGQ